MMTITSKGFKAALITALFFCVSMSLMAQMTPGRKDMGKIVVHTNLPEGTEVSMSLLVSYLDKGYQGVWVDWNNNGKFDSTQDPDTGELKYTEEWYTTPNYMKAKIKSQVFTIYGPCKFASLPAMGITQLEIDCQTLTSVHFPKNELTGIDFGSTIPYLHWVNLNTNKINTPIDFSKTPRIDRIQLFSNQMSAEVMDQTLRSLPDVTGNGVLGNDEYDAELKGKFSAYGGRKIWIKDQADKKDTSAYNKESIEHAFGKKWMVIAYEDYVLDPIDEIDLFYDAPTAIDDVEGVADQLYVYPNPTQGEVSVDVTSALLGQDFAVYDVSGRQVFVQTIHGLKSHFDLSFLADGLYVAKMGACTQRIQVQK